MYDQWEKNRKEINFNASQYVKAVLNKIRNHSFLKATLQMYSYVNIITSLLLSFLKRFSISSQIQQNKNCVYSRKRKFNNIAFVIVLFLKRCITRQIWCLLIIQDIKHGFVIWLLFCTQAGCEAIKLYQMKVYAWPEFKFCSLRR